MAGLSSPPAAANAARFAKLVNRPRIWAVASIHAELGRLRIAHDALWERLQPRDGLLYLGNMIGRNTAAIETIDELLRFRRDFIAREGSFASDLGWLRGSQEEMWQKLLELQFAPNPGEVFAWMLEQGVGATLESYGFTLREGQGVMRQGPVAITRWTNSVRARVNAQAGHTAFFTAIRRAGYCSDEKLLFVHAGFDPALSLENQRDNFWWGGTQFNEMTQAYGPYRRIIRGYDRQHAGLVMGERTISIDHGCGFGGGLIAACFTPEGEIADGFEA